MSEYKVPSKIKRRKYSLRSQCRYYCKCNYTPDLPGRSPRKRRRHRHDIEGNCIEPEANGSFVSASDSELDFETDSEDSGLSSRNSASITPEIHQCCGHTNGILSNGYVTRTSVSSNITVCCNHRHHRDNHHNSIGKEDVVVNGSHYSEKPLEEHLEMDKRRRPIPNGRVRNGAITFSKVDTTTYRQTSMSSSDSVHSSVSNSSRTSSLRSSRTGGDDTTLVAPPDSGRTSSSSYQTRLRSGSALRENSLTADSIITPSSTFYSYPNEKWSKTPHSRSKTSFYEDTLMSSDDDEDTRIINNNNTTSTNYFSLCLHYLAAPIYWIVMQIVIIEKWFLKRAKFHARRARHFRQSRWLEMVSLLSELYLRIRSLFTSSSSSEEIEESEYFARETRSQSRLRQLAASTSDAGIVKSDSETTSSTWISSFMKITTILSVLQFWKSSSHSSSVVSQVETDTEEEIGVNPASSDTGLLYGIWRKTKAIFPWLLLLFGILLLFFLGWSNRESLSDTASRASSMAFCGFRMFLRRCLMFVSYIASLPGVLAGLMPVNITSLFGGPSSVPSEYLETIPVPTSSTDRPPLPPGAVMLEESKYLEILSRLRELEEKLEHHSEEHKQFHSSIKLLQQEMMMFSTKGKSSEEILKEVLTFKLGETSQGKIVTLATLMDVMKDSETSSKENMEINTRLLNQHVAELISKVEAELEALKSRVESNEQLTEEKMVTVEKEEPKIDLNEIKAAILPVLIRELEVIQKPCKMSDCGGSSSMNANVNQDVEKLIKMALAKYDADKTGLPDLALESAGGSILSTRCTKSSKMRNSVISIWGIKIWSPLNNPRTIIQPGVVPGDCWAFEGSVGDIVIKLIAPSIVDGFTIEHISKSISPYGNIDSAPHKFQVLGLTDENDPNGFDFGTFHYEDNGEPLQHFEVKNFTNKYFPVVELKILSNHGSLSHTCLYRFRVHGAISLGDMLHQ